MSASYHGTVEQLAALGLGDLDPAEAAVAVREALGAAPALGENVYAALRDVVWRTVSSREFGPDLGRWFHVIEHAGTGLRAVGQDAVAERVDVLSDLLHQSAAFARRQPLEQVLDRKHVGTLLSRLAEHDGACRREDLRREVGLSDPNLSRVLALLESHGLVKRERLGKEKLLELTQAGRHVVRRLGGAAPPAVHHDVAPPAIEHLALPTACWDGQGRLVAANTVAREFARATGAESAIDDLSRWRAAIGASSAGVRGEVGEETWLLRISDERWCDATFSSLGGSLTAFYAVDVTHRQEREAELTAEVQALREGLARAKKQVAELEERYFAYARTAVRVRDILAAALPVTEEERGQRSLAKSSAAAIAGASRERVEAFRYLMCEFLGPPEPAEPSRHVDVAAYVERTVASMKKIAGWGITLELSHLKGVRVPAFAARHIVNQLLFGATKPGSTPGGRLTAMRDHDGLVLLLKTYRDAVSPALFAVESATETGIFGCMNTSWTPPMVAQRFGIGGSRHYAWETSGEFTIHAGDGEDGAEISMAIPMRTYEVP